MAIPKIIHYCWFGGKPKNELAEKCIRSWKKFCPDYELVEWNEENFDISTAPLYVRQAYEAGRWAFVTDYVRLVGLTQMGGIYMDTDVEVIKPLDKYLHHQGFAGFETLDRVQTGLLACEKGHPLFLEFLEHYHSAVFLKEDGTQDITTNVEVLTALCERHGLRLDGTYQELDGFAVYPKDVFCPVEYETMKLKKTRRTAVIHWFSGSWHTQQERDALEAEKRRQREERNSNLRVKIGTALLGEKGYEKVKSLLKG